ncbi:uncharacterized protein LOC129001405 [Macrosteles quadrilineatus]|uniref:uncharacterized protein LOC129001405 n=1 Tax=Macrosteles quadrilineatus TaxID=74068 RepID=UPI0023E1E8B5|nr:uncharacterized protein LOC129001405 [Macrosteles quadrilineatus]
MNYEREEDPAREYEMIWALFQGKEEEETPKKNKEGVTVKILKFLFGSGGGETTSEPVDDYREKRRFHRHVYQPSPRHAGAPGHTGGMSDVHDGQTWTQKRLEPPPIAPPEPMGAFYSTSCKVLVACTIASIMILITTAANCIKNIKAMIDKSDEEVD